MPIFWATLYSERVGVGHVGRDCCCSLNVRSACVKVVSTCFIPLSTPLLAPQIWHLLTLCAFINFIYLLTCSYGIIMKYYYKNYYEIIHE